MWVSSQSFHRLHLLHTLGQFQLLLLGPVFPAMDAWTKQMRKTEKPWSRFKSRHVLRIMIAAKTCSRRRLEALSILSDSSGLIHSGNENSSFFKGTLFGGAWRCLASTSRSMYLRYGRVLPNAVARDKYTSRFDSCRGQMNVNATKVRSGSRNYLCDIHSTHSRTLYVAAHRLYQTTKSGFKAFTIRWLLTITSVISLYERSTVHAFERMPTAIKIFIAAYGSASS